MKGFPNMAGQKGRDDEIAAELEAAGIEIYRHECLRKGEVATDVIGGLHGWKFERAWYYWRAEGPGIEVTAAERLHASHGREVRVNGHCGCPTPREQFHGLAVGSYHVDTPSALKALADTIREIVATPSPSPVSAPSPAGGVREALARRLYIAHTHATNRGPDRIDLSDVDLNEWFDNLAKMPLSGQSFVALWNAMADAALSSPATPEPVSAPAGEVVAWMWKHEDGTLSFVSDPDTKRIWEETMKRVLVPVYAHPTSEKEGRS